MNARATSLFCQTLSLTTVLLVVDVSMAPAQQQQATTGRSRLFQRLRDDDRTTRANPNNPQTPKSTYNSAKQAQPNNRNQVPTLAPPMNQAKQQGMANPQKPNSESVMAEGSLQVAANGNSVVEANTGPTSLHAKGYQYEFGMTLEEKEGTLSILSMLSDSSAQRDGLKIGDVIRSIGGVNLQSQSEFYEVAGLMQSGDQIELVVERSHKEQSILLSIGQPMDTRGVNVAEYPADQNSIDALLTDPSPTLEIVPPSASADNFIGGDDNLKSAATADGDQESSWSQRALRESIIHKERELLQLQEEIEALKRQLAIAEQSQSF